MSRPADNGSPPPELQLPDDFPGLGGGGDDPYIDHTEVKAIISALRGSLGSLRGTPMPNMSATWTGPGTINEVSYLGNIGSQETGKWEAATAFGDNLTQAYTVFHGSYEQLLDHVDKWVDAVERAILNYEKFHQDSSA